MHLVLIINLLQFIFFIFLKNFQIFNLSDEIKYFIFHIIFFDFIIKFYSFYHIK